MKYLFFGKLQFQCILPNSLPFITKASKIKDVVDCKMFYIISGDSKNPIQFPTWPNFYFKESEVIQHKTVIGQSTKKFYDPKGCIQRLWTLK